MLSVMLGSPHVCHVCALLLPTNHFQDSWNIFPILENDINSAKLMLVFAAVKMLKRALSNTDVPPAAFAVVAAEAKDISLIPEI